MRRFLAVAGICAILAILFPVSVPAPTYTYVVRELAQTFQATMTFASNIVLSASGATVDGKDLDLVPATTKVVHICASGCEYTTIGSACSGETSTSASPIIYYVHAGTYTASSAISCSGEDSATFMGDGPTVTKIISTQTGAGLYGTLELGNSEDVTITGMYLKGHRVITMDDDTTGGGDVFLSNLIIETQNVNADEDCFWSQDAGSGTKFHIRDMVCRTNSDGWTFTAMPATWEVHASNLECENIGTSAQESYCWNFGSTPTVFVDTGSRYRPTAAGTGGAKSLYAYRLSGDSTGCTSGCSAQLFSPHIAIANTDSNGENANTVGIRIESTNTELARLDIHDANVLITTTDSTTGTTWGLDSRNGTTVVNVFGGRWRTSGGNANLDFDGNGVSALINLYGVDYETATSSDIFVGDVKKLRATSQAQFGPSTPSSTSPYIAIADTNSPIGIVLENLDASNAEANPPIRMINSVAAGSEYVDIYVDAADNFVMLDKAANTLLTIEKTTGDMTFNSNSQVKGMGLLEIPAASAPGIFNDGGIAVDETANQLAFQSASAIYALDPVRTACYSQRGLATTDDDFVFFIANQALTITSVGCFCVGTCGVNPTFSLEDNNGNAMTITGTNPTCGVTTTEAAYAAVTAGGGMVTGEGLRFDTGVATGTAGDWVTICVTYTVDRQ